MSSPTLAELEAKYFPPGLSLGNPHSADSMVTPHVDGEAFFGAIANVLKTMRGPGDLVYLTSWWLDHAFTLRFGSDPIGTVLLNLAGAGADVRVIAAAAWLSVSTEGLSLASYDYWNAKYAEAAHLALAPRACIRAVRALRNGRFNGRVPLEGRVLLDWGGTFDSRHEKSAVAFSATTGELHAFVSGMDFAPSRLSNEPHGGPHGTYWHDAGVQLQGQAALEVLENFRTRWDETVTLPARRYKLDGIEEPFNPKVITAPGPAPPPGPLPPPPDVPAGSYLGAGVRVVRSYDRVRAFKPWAPPPDKVIKWNKLPATGITEVRTVLQNAIMAAKRYIYVEDQTLNPSRVARVYVSHMDLYPRVSDACARGVKVIFVTEGVSGADSPAKANLDMSSEITSRILDPLNANQRKNFALFYVKDIKVHAKVLIVDDEFVSVGSANFWDRSTRATESELSAAIVHPGEKDSLVARLRVRLWRGHLRVAQSPAVDAELLDLDKSLGYFHAGWGTGISFPHGSSALIEVPP